MRLTLVSLLVLTWATPSFAAPEMRVAVMEFTPASADPEHAALGKGLQSMVTTDLSSVAAIKVVERERLKEVQGELRLSHGAGFDKATATKIGKLAGATHLFVGSFVVVSETMRLDGRLIVVASGEVLLAEQVAGDKTAFFELEQTLVQKLIALLGVRLEPKERAVLRRAHTADFQAFQKFSMGIQSFDDGRVEQALKELHEATAIDKDFKLASLTLDEYERLAAQVRAKAEAAGRVEDEVERLGKHQAIAAEVAVLKQLWPLLDRKGQAPDDKLLRVAAACLLAHHYYQDLGYKNRGPVSSADLAAMGFDRFTLARTGDALYARAWLEAADVFPRIPPLCVGLGILSSDPKYPVDKQIGYQINDAAKLTQDSHVLFSWVGNSVRVDPYAESLHLDLPGRIRLWEKLYALAQKFPGVRDEDLGSYEESIAELRHQAGDFDGATQMLALASRHTKDSYQLRKLAEEIDRNKQAKLRLAPASPEIRELYLLGLEDREIELLKQPEARERLVGKLHSARQVRPQRGFILLHGIAVWDVSGHQWGVRLGTGPRTSNLKTDELRYEGVTPSHMQPPSRPTLFPSAIRGKRLTIRAAIDQSPPPPDWVSFAKAPVGGGEAGVAFAMTDVLHDVKVAKEGPPHTFAYAVLLAGDRVRLVQVTRNAEYKQEVTELAQAPIGPSQGKRAMEVGIEPGKVTVVVDRKRASFPWKPEGDGDGFAGVAFYGLGYAAVSGLEVTATP
jgi:TolB-like protein